MAEIRIKDASPSRDAWLLRLGLVLMVAGIALGVVAFLLSHSTRIDYEQRDYLDLALTGVAVAVAGSAVFLRYSLAHFLRFWLARLIYEQRATVDPGAGRASGSSRP
jgi:hypothetical protein